jgi:ribosome-associated toxin RatA of RatAB toxin-antitoxin module
MNTIKRNALVPYSARQMFELVNNIEDYPRFLPWCHSSEVVSCNDKEVVASLEIAWKGIHKSFTTHNDLTPFKSIKISLVKGPLRHLDGLWKFHNLGDDEGCKITLDLEFELAGHFFDRVFEPIFNHIANSLVDAFCKRAVEVYGDK